MIQQQKPIEYTYVPAKSTQKQIHFSNREVGHLALATVLVVGVGLSLQGFAGISNGDYSLTSLSIVAFTASFLAHEIAHKAVAQKHGLWAEFRVIPMGALLTALSMALPLKFISPGAVMLAGTVNAKTIGKTAVAGPATNVVLATMFTVTAAALPNYSLSLGAIAWFNAWIAAINLIPFGIFDGMKVFSWDKRAWALVFATSVCLMIALTMAFLGSLY